MAAPGASVFSLLSAAPRNGSNGYDDARRPDDPVEPAVDRPGRRPDRVPDPPRLTPMDAEQALGHAIRALAATDRAGTAHTLGPATSGHWCHTCRTPSMIAADVLRIDEHGTTPIAVFYHCPNC